MLIYLPYLFMTVQYSCDGCIDLYYCAGVMVVLTYDCAGVMVILTYDCAGVMVVLTYITVQV